jgi:hypothetical protein
MTTMETTIPASAQTRRYTKIAAIAALVTALVLALAGTVALAANALRDSSGYFNWPTETFTTGGYAIAMKTVDISKAPQWALNAGVDRVRVQANSDRPIFIGIAPTADLDRYLRGTQHDDISGLNYNPFQVDYDHTSGHAPNGLPAKKTFWVKSTSGDGKVALDWKPRPGSWRAVVMNADNSRGVTSELMFGVHTSALWWLGAGLLAAALIAAAIAAAFFARVRLAR